MNTEKTVNQIAEYNPLIAEMNQLQDKFKGLVYDVSIPEQYDNAVIERKAFVKLDNKIDACRKKLADPIYTAYKAINEQGKTISAPLTERIAELDKLIDVQDKIQAQINADIEKHIADIRATPLAMIGKSSDDIQDAHQSLLDIEVEDFGGYHIAAQNAINEALAQIEPMIAIAKNQEILAAQQVEQQAILNARQAEIDKAEREQQERANEAKRLEDLEKARLEGIAQAQRDAQLAIENEIANKLKAEALKPDQEKFLQWLQLAIDNAPTLSDTALNDRLQSIRNRLVAVVKELA